MQTTPAVSPPRPRPQASGRRLWVAGGMGAALAAVILLVGWLALGGDGTTEAAGLAETSPGPTGDEATSPSPGSSSPAASGETTPAAPAGAPPASAPAASAPAAVASEPGAERCEADGYSVEVPDGWASPDCRAFTPGVVSSTGPVRTEIDLFWAQRETYDAALDRIEETLVVRNRQSTTVADRPATAFRIEETDAEGTAGNRLVFVVQADAGVFFASANELVGGVGPIDDPAAHFQASVEVLETMMDSVRF
ncbi:MAG: hypothetical protein AAGK32_05940 [Actinomycetota bacterium]